VGDFPGGGDDPAARRFDAPDDLALHVEVTEQPVKPFGDEDGRLAELDGFDGGAELRPVGEGGAAGYRADVAVAVDVLVPDVVGAEREAFVRGLLDHGADLDFGAVPGVVVALGDADDADGSVGGGGVGEHRLERALRARSAGELRALVADVARRRWPWLPGRSRWMAPAARVTLPTAGTIVLGRSRGCDVVMSAPTVSRRHLELRAVDGAWLAVDLRSSNGTWLLGRRVRRARVGPGDQIVLGDCAVVLEPADG
jgi:hypothetical protein